MKNTRAEIRKFRIFFVLGAFSFGLFVISLAKTIGDNPIIPIIFVIGWLMLLIALFIHFRNLKKKPKE